VKILDFGISRRIIGNNLLQKHAYTMMGTPCYAAPNLMLGEGYSAFCDVWSVGVMIYEMLIGKNPFESVGPVCKF
jgi:serine/threonine protein kinase